MVSPERFWMKSFSLLFSAPLKKKNAFELCATPCTDEICAIPGVQMKRLQNAAFNHRGKQLHI